MPSPCGKQSPPLLGSIISSICKSDTLMPCFIVLGHIYCSGVLDSHGSQFVYDKISFNHNL